MQEGSHVEVKVYMSVDMEGATGITNSKMCSPKEKEYKRGRELLTKDVNAAVKGAVDAGAEEVLINDSHGPMTNILIEDLADKARLISGSNKQLLQMAGIDESFDAAFFIAYHAREGTHSGMLNHTIMGSVVTEIKCNGHPVGETGINAKMAGYYGVPVVMVTGDDKLSDEASELIPGIETVVVKEAMDRHTADCLPPGRTEKMIRKAAKEALDSRDDIKPHKADSPVVFDLTYKTTPSTTMAGLFPSVEQIGPKQIRVQAENYPDAYKKLWGCIILGRNAMGGVLES